MLEKIENIWKALVLNKDKDMAKLNWAMVGGGEGSQIGPAHRLVHRQMDYSNLQRVL